MQMTKHFTQYSESNISIILSIEYNGKIKRKSSIKIYSNEQKKNKKQYQLKNKNKIKKYKKNYRQENKTYFKNYGLKYYKENKEHIIKSVKKWRENNPQKVRLIDHKRYKNRFSWGIPIPINDYFENSHLHHLHENKDYQTCIFIPAELHKSIWHSHKDSKSMNKINKAALEWFETQ